MTELTYDAFISAADAPAASWPQLFLIHGDDYRVADICERLLGRLVGDGARDLMVERLEGGDEAVHQAIDRLNTFALLAERKIVVLQDARFFFGKQDAGALLDSAEKAYRSDHKRKAGFHLMAFLALKGVSAEDTDAEARQAIATATPGSAEAAPDWAEDLMAYCRDHGMTPPRDDGTPVARLTRCIETGFPPGHVLIITAESVDKRKAVYKTIAAAGTVVDCRLPKGNLMAERKIQEQALDDTARTLLAPSGKTLAPKARALLMERIGCDLRLFAANIEKLVTYSGERTTISADDVRHLVPHTRQEPIYELTAAVAERNAPKAVMLLRRMVAEETIHPLQALAALSNQFRRLTVARQFVDSTKGRHWRPDLAYPVFTRQVLPELLAFQEDLDAAVAALDPVHPSAGTAAGNRRKGKSGFPADLRPAKNPKSPFPVFQLLKQASRFTMDELVAAMGRLAAVDGELKRQGAQDTAPLEAAIFAIARERR